MTAAVKIVTEAHLDAARDAVLGLDPAQAPTEPEALEERLSIAHPAVTSSVQLILNTSQARHLKRALPAVYTILEAANRGFPEEMRAGLRPKAFVAAIAAVGGEARQLVVEGPVPSPTRERQPTLAAFLDQHFVAPGALPANMPVEEKIGLVALSLGTLRAVDRQLAGVGKPDVAPPTPGRNDPCHCGSGKKFKKCHGLGIPETAAE